MNTKKKVCPLAVLNSARIYVENEGGEAQAEKFGEAVSAVRELVAAIDSVAFNLERIQPLDENARRFAVEDLRTALAKFQGGAA